MEELLNDLLADDVPGNGYVCFHSSELLFSKAELTRAQILAISEYVGYASQTSKKFSCGKHKCVFIYNCIPDYGLIISEEISGEKIVRLPNIRDEKGQVLLISMFFFPNIKSIANRSLSGSVSPATRDILRQIVRPRLGESLKMVELEYQP